MGKTNQCEDILRETKVLLEPQSLFLMAEDARFVYRHGISRHVNVWTPGSDSKNGIPNKPLIVKRKDPYRRVSLTIRHLLPGRRQVTRSKGVDLEENKR